MTDAEISRQLALAIGWPEQYTCNFSVSEFLVWCAVGEFGLSGHWRSFDYRDPSVIWPIAERFDCFPTLYPTTKWTAWVPGPAECTASAETAAKAVALAVIKAKEQK